MVDVKLSPEQTKALETSPLVRFINPDGRAIGRARMHRITDEQLADIERRADDDGPWRTTEEMLQRVRARTQS